MRIKKLPTSVRPNPSDAPHKKTIHHFVGTNSMVASLYVLTDNGWTPLDSPTSFAGLNVVELSMFSFVDPVGGTHLVCLLSERPVILYWPVIDTILVLDTNKKGWDEEQKEIRWANYRFHI